MAFGVREGSERPFPAELEQGAPAYGPPLCAVLVARRTRRTVSDAANRIRAALSKITGSKRRSDGTYNYDREACSQLAEDALAALDELLAENERLRRDRDREHARFMGRHDAAVDWQLRAEAAEARCARLEAALREIQRAVRGFALGLGNPDSGWDKIRQAEVRAREALAADHAEEARGDERRSDRP